MSPPTLNLYLLAIGIAIAGGSFRGFAGFGSGLMMAPLLTIIFPATIAVPVLILLSLVGALRLVPEVYREIDARRVLTVSIPAMMLIPVGIAVLAFLDAPTVRRVVSGVVLLLVVIMLTGFRVRDAHRKRVLIPAGVVGGVLTGIGAVGGPPIVLTFLSLNESPRQTRANLIGYFAMTGVAAITLMILSGVGSPVAVGKLFAVTAPFYFVAIHVGSRAFRTANQDGYRKVALIFLAIVALLGLVWVR